MNYARLGLRANGILPFEGKVPDQSGEKLRYHLYKEPVMDQTFDIGQG